MPTITEIMTSGARDIAFSPDGSRLYVARSDGSITVFNASTWTQIASWSVGTSLGAMALSDDGLSLVVVETSPPSGAAVAYRVNTQTGTSTTLAQSAAAPFMDVFVVGNGQAILTGGSGVGTYGSTHLRWDFATGATGAVDGGRYYSNQSYIAESGRYALFGEANISNGPLYLYNQVSGAFTASYEFGQGSNFGQMAVSEVGGMVAKFVYHNTIQIFDLSLNLIRTLMVDFGPMLDQGPLIALTFSPDGQSLFYQMRSNIVRVDPATGAVLQTIPYELAARSSNLTTASELIVSPDGTRLIVRDAQDGDVDVIDITPEVETHTGTTGPDTLAGGTGDDLYIVNHVNDIVTEAAGEGFDRINTSVAYTLASGASIEVLASFDPAAATGLTLTGNALGNRIIGDVGNNILSGDAGDDVLEGLDGDDTLWGGFGNDILIGGAGNDRLNGGIGADQMQGGAGDDVYVVDNIEDSISDTGGTDSVEISTSGSGYTLAAGIENATTVSLGAMTLNGNSLRNSLTTGAGNDQIYGYGGDDFIRAGDGDDTVYGGQGNDSLQGGDGTDQLDGGDGDDRLDGGAGADTMIGGFGDDYYVIDNAGDVIQDFAGTNTVETTTHYTLGSFVQNLVLVGTTLLVGTGNASNNSITGGSGGDVLRGLDGDDTLDGRAGDDQLEGGAGNDTLTGGLGNNTLIGGTGNDIYVTLTNQDSIIELAGEGADELRTAALIQVAPSNVENLTFTGTGSFIGVGNALDNAITGGANYDELFGRDGNDALSEGTGSVADAMLGGLGNDIYVITNRGTSTIEFVGEGTDTVQTTFSIYGLQANIENLTLTDNGEHLAAVGNDLNNVIRGGTGADSLFGRAGNDMLYGGSGAANTMLGQEGNDTYVVSAVGDSIFENASEGNDTVQTALTSFVLPDNVENLIFIGQTMDHPASNNVAIGNSGANYISTGIGDDIISAGAGDDVLYGGHNGDELTGGAGADRFLFNVDDFGYDRITDFTPGSDRILVITNAGGPIFTSTYAFRLFNATDAWTAETTFIYNPASGEVFVDTDGSGPSAMRLIAQVNLGTTLTINDFGYWTGP